MPQPDETRLNDLKQRWAQDPGSRLYLQLADEHRKLGQPAEAEAVLVKGLENRPNDLSGLVALGRSRLELSKLDEALETLESVVARDPAHLVANKLLLETHLQRGDAEKAGERLEICKLLNDRDPELEELEVRLAALRTSPPEREEPAPPEDDPSAEMELEALEAAGEDAPPELELDALDEELPAPDFDALDGAGDEMLPEMELEALDDVGNDTPAWPAPEELEEVQEEPEPEVAAEPAAAPPPEPETTAEPAAPTPTELEEEPFAFLTRPEPATAEPGPAAEPEAAPEPEPPSEQAETETEAEAVAEFEAQAATADAEETPMPSPSTTPPSNGDEIFVLGDETSTEVPTLESLWIEHASPKRPDDPFAGLSAVSTLAPGEVFHLAPPPVVSAEVEAGGQVAAGVEGGGLAASEALPVASPAGGQPAGGPVVYEELTEAARADLLLDTQRTEFTVDDTGSIEIEPGPAAAEEARPSASAVGEAAEVEAAPPPESAQETSARPATEVAPAAPAPEEDAEAEHEEVAARAPSEPEPKEASATPAPEAPEPAVSEEVATVALGSLYLKQGHVDEAARIFQKVLARDPGNHAALAGLRLTRRPQEGTELTAMDLMADRSLSGTIPAGTTAKKLLVLTQYLKHLRTARDRNHVH